MTEQEQQLINNLRVVTRRAALTADEHVYFQNGLQYLEDKLKQEGTPKEETKEAAPQETSAAS